MRGTPFVHLHLHSEYSLLDGFVRFDPLLARCADLKQTAVALTDHGNLFGAVEFYGKALSAGIKPILGIETYVATGSRSDRRRSSDGGPSEANHHLTLLARDAEGYRNLVLLSTAGFLEGFYHKPRVDKELLRSHAGGLIALSGCLKGELAWRLARDDRMGALAAAEEFRGIFPDAFFVELHRHGLPEEDAVRPRLVELARSLQLPLVATNDVHYLRAEDVEAHDALLCIGTNSQISDERRLRYPGGQFFLKSGDEMAALFADTPDAVAATVEIAQACNVQLATGGLHLPRLELGPDSPGPDEELHEACRAGLRRRFGDPPPAVASERVEHELSVIRQVGYSGYFLIVADIVAFARREGIPVGPGRGSAAGSLVAYALGITDVDPLRHGLLFERFLNPERVSPPDIDVDFCMRGRPRVIEYIVRRHGRENVAQIITFGRLQAKAALRDVARVSGMPLKDVDRLAKMVPNGPDVTLASVAASVPEFAAELRADPRAQKAVELARRIEGVVRHASTHAAGIVIADRPLTEYVPLYRASEDEVTTQFDMRGLEALGLLKMDVLGLRTLTVLDDASARVRAEGGRPLDLSSLPLDDAATFDLLSSGHTLGVFQLDSAGMRDLARQLKPRRFEDVTVLISLFRPGASRMIEMFLERRDGRVPVAYEHPSLEALLAETYGIILYQEQVMRIAAEVAGFPLARADLLRRAMGKKDPDLMERQREAFLAGAAARGVPRQGAERIFRQMAEFAGYGFNKSHGAAYALLAYRTAYLKANHPLEFLAALLTSEAENTDKLVEYAAEARRMGIAVLAPDVNRSEEAFSVEEGKLRFGLSAVKNLGTHAVEDLLGARRSRGPFGSVGDFAARIEPRRWNARMVESLAKAGAFDAVSEGAHRAQVAAYLCAAVASRAERGTGAGDLPALLSGGEGGGSRGALPEAERWDEPQLLAFEKEVLGIYLSGHPLARVAHRVEAYGTHTTEEAKRAPDGTWAVVCGLATAVRVRTSRRGERFATFAIEDLHGLLDVVAFQDALADPRASLTADALLLVRGRMAADALIAERRRLMAVELLPLERAGSRFARSVHLHLAASHHPVEVMRALHELALEHPGPCALRIHLRQPGGREVVVSPRNIAGVAPEDDFLRAARRLLGGDAVKVRSGELRRTAPAGPAARPARVPA